MTSEVNVVAERGPKEADELASDGDDDLVGVLASCGESAMYARRWKVTSPTEKLLTVKKATSE